MTPAVAHYWRYYARHEHEAETVDEAFRFLADGEDQELSSVKVVDGKTVYERGTPEFDRRLDEAWEARV